MRASSLILKEIDSLDELHQKEDEYRAYLDMHIGNVYEALKKLHTLGIPFIEQNFNELCNICREHDASKYTIDEFDAYRRHWYPTKEEEEHPNDEEYEAAVKHHIKNNKHHWDYWVDDKGEFIEPEGGTQERQIYAVEMLCDWMSMSHYCRNHIREWLDSGDEDVKLPDYIWEFINPIIDILETKPYRLDEWKDDKNED